MESWNMELEETLQGWDDGSSRMPAIQLLTMLYQKESEAGLGSVISYIIESLTLKDKETKAQRLREIYEAGTK